MLKLVSITRRFGNHVALDNVTVTFAKKGLVAIVGPSGCGKTTLLNILAGIDNNYEGSYLRSYQNMSQLTDDERRLFRLQEVGYVFQDFRLFETDSVLDNVLLVCEACSKSRRSVNCRYALSVIKRVGLANKDTQKVSLLSGGEKQRVAIARALAANPSMLLCDEPTGALDAKSAEIVMKILATIAQSRLVIIVTHDEQLALHYCSYILKMRDGRVIDSTALPPNKIKTTMVGLNLDKSEKSHLPLATMFRRAISIIKTRKGRLLVNNAVMSLGLFGIGLSIIMTFSIETKIMNGFSSFLDERMIVMSQRHEVGSIGSVYSASYSDLNNIYTAYEHQLSGIGVSYNVNFETFFKTRDEMFISSTSHKIILPRFSTRQIGDFLWLDDYANLFVYPQQSKAVPDDGLIIGIPYNDMVGICYSLHIERNYVSLGEYIHGNAPLITLGVANEEWAYDDEQVFHLFGVVESQAPTIYHSNHLWSEYVFETKMRLPSFAGGKRDYPWQLHKIYFLMAKETNERFLSQTYFDERMKDYIFQLAGSDYHPTLCPISEPCSTNRLLVFHADKNTLDTTQIEQLRRFEPRINTYIPISDGGYFYQPNSFVSGFSKNIYASLSRAKIEQVIDADTLSEDEYAGYTIDPPYGVLQGNILSSLNGGITFDSNLSEIIIGRAPTSFDEIVVSEGVASYFSSNREIIGQTVQIAVNYANTPYNERQIEKHYQIVEVRVTGVKRGSKMVFHHYPFWSVGFFQLKAGVSAFELLTKHLLLYLHSNSNKQSVIERLNNWYPNMQFVDPMAGIQEGLDETLNLLKIVLLAFSSLAVITSLFLFFIVMIVTIEENRDDILLMKYLGISRNDTRNCFIVTGLVISFPAFLIASVEIIAADFLVNHVIEGYVGTNLPYVFDPSALLVIIVSAIAIAYLSSYLAFAKHDHRNKEIRRPNVKKM